MLAFQAVCYSGAVTSLASLLAAEVPSRWSAATRPQVGEAAHPDVHLPPAKFARAIGDRVDPTQELVSAIDQLCAADLYLACAALDGCRTAQRKIMALCAAAAKLTASRSGQSADELAQVVATHALVSKDGAPAKLTGYSGRGRLAGWLRAASIGIGIDLGRQEQGRAKAISESEANELRTTLEFADPVVAQLKTEFRAAFKAAFQSAVARLSARELNLLRLRYLDGVGDQDVATMYQVHRTTVVRWLVAIRGQLQVSTREHLATSMGLSPSQLDSLIALVHSELELSLSRALAGAAAR